MRAAKIRDFSFDKDRPFCFEIVANAAGKKGMKKYNFSTETDSERKKWLESLNKASQAKISQRQIGGGDVEIGNPMLSGNNTELTAPKPEQMNFRTSRAGPQPGMKMGFLSKKSPAIFSGWQKRFFVLKDGELSYYLTVKLKDDSYSYHSFYLIY